MAAEKDQLLTKVLGVGKVPGRSHDLEVQDADANYVLFLGCQANDLVLPITIGEPEAISIDMALNGIKAQRPITHDLVVNLIDKLQYEIERVTIDCLIDAVYTATIHLRSLSSGKDVKIDARPSDSVAIALRAGCQIYVDKSLKDQMVPRTSLKLPESWSKNSDKDDEEIDSPYGV
ncbi:MAG: bifunctional nuclease family protein [Thermoprotei archaeon]